MKSVMRMCLINIEINRRNSRIELDENDRVDKFYSEFKVNKSL